MIQIAYVSSTRGLLTTDGITDLLIASRRKNRQRGITGILLYKEGNVLQVIEGDESQVLALFLAIEKDRRHTGVIRLYRKNIATRDFPDWRMGFLDRDAENARNLEGFSNFFDADFDINAIKSLPAKRLLSSFKANNR